MLCVVLCRVSLWSWCCWWSWCVFGVCVRCGTLKKREKKVCGFKNASVCAFTTRTCVETCARGAGFHGDVLDGHTGCRGVIVSSAYQNLPAQAYHVLQRFTGETFGSFPFSSLRIDREQHVPDSSNHSLSLIKLFSFSCPEGNKLLDCPVGLLPFSPGITNDVNVSIATSLHQRLPFSGRVHQLSSPDTLCLTQTTFKITEYTHIFVHTKNIYIFVYVHKYPFKKYLYIYYVSS